MKVWYGPSVSRCRFLSSGMIIVGCWRALPPLPRVGFGCLGVRRLAEMCPVNSCAQTGGVVWLHLWSVPAAMYGVDLDHTLSSSLPRSPFNSDHKIWDAVQPLPVHVVFLSLFISVPLFKVKIHCQVFGSLIC